MRIRCQGPGGRLGTAVSGDLSSPAKVESLSGSPAPSVGLGFGEAVALAIEDEFGVVDQGHAVLVGEIFGSCADEVDMRALVEDEAGGLDGVAEAFDAGYSAGAKRGAVHEEGVELDAALAR